MKSNTKLLLVTLISLPPLAARAPSCFLSSFFSCLSDGISQKGEAKTSDISNLAFLAPISA